MAGRRLSAPQAAAIILLLVGIAQLVYAFFFSGKDLKLVLIVIAMMNFVLALVLWRFKYRPK